MEQLWGAIGAVFASWNGKRAIAYRNIENIPHDWGTAVNVQTMVLEIWAIRAPRAWPLRATPATATATFTANI